MSSSYHLEQLRLLSPAAFRASSTSSTDPDRHPLQAPARPSRRPSPLLQPLWPPLRPSFVPYPPPPQLPPLHQLLFPTPPFPKTLVWMISSSSPPSSVAPNTITSPPTMPLFPSVGETSSKSSQDSRPAGGMVFLEKRGAGFPQITSTSFQTRKQISALRRWNYSSNSSSSNSSQRYSLCPPIRHLPQRALPPSRASRPPPAWLNPGYMQIRIHPLGTGVVGTNSPQRAWRARHFLATTGCPESLRMAE
jgi:hypothetical protein